MRERPTEKSFTIAEKYLIYEYFARALARPWLNFFYISKS